MKDVQVWNPSSLTMLAAREFEPAAQVIHRDEKSIASLRWHGVDPEERSKVDWGATRSTDGVEKDTLAKVQAPDSDSRRAEIEASVVKSSAIAEHS